MRPRLLGRALAFHITISQSISTEYENPTIGISRIIQPLNTQNDCSRYESVCFLISFLSVVAPTASVGLYQTEQRPAPVITQSCYYTLARKLINTFYSVSVKSKNRLYTHRKWKKKKGRGKKVAKTPNAGLEPATFRSLCDIKV